MTGPPIETELYLDVNQNEADRALAALAARVENISEVVKRLGLSGKQGIEGFNASLGQTLGLVNAQIGRLESFERSMRAQSRRPVAGLADDQAFSRTTRAASVYAQTLGNASTAAEGLQARLNRIDKQISEGGDQGNLASRNTLSRRMGLEQAQRDLLAIERQLQRTEEQARRTGQAFAGPQSGVQAARDTLTQSVLNPQVTNTTFQAQLRELRDAQVVYQEAVNAARLSRIQTAREERASLSAGEKAVSRGIYGQNLRQLREEINAERDLTQVEARRVEIAEGRNGLEARLLQSQGQEAVKLGEALRLEEARLVIVDRRMRALERENATANRPAGQPAGPESRISQILSPGYAGAALARTTVYGGAAMAAYGVFNTLQGGAQFVAEFDDKLHQLQAIAGATNTQMVGLTQSIIEVGRSSRFSLIDLAEMATKLAQAGVTAGDMSRALGAVSTLAAASGSTPAEAVDLVTASLGSFQLQGNEAARVADLMTTALNRTRLTVQQAALAVQYVGTTAYDENITLEQLLATAAALSQAGIRSGSTIGTGMRQFLVDLQNPSAALTEQLQRLHLTMADVDVTTRGLPAVLETLSTSGFGAAEAYGAMERRGAAFYLTAKNNLPLMDQLQTAMADSGAAAEANASAMNSLESRWQRFKNVIADSMGDTMTGVLNILNHLVQSVTDGIAEQTARAEALRRGTADGSLPWYQRDLTPGFDQFTERGFNIMARPYTGGNPADVDHGFGTWLNSLTRDVNDATGHMDELNTAMARTGEASQSQRDKIAALDHEIERLSAQHDDLATHQERVTTETVGLMARFSGLAENITGTTGDINGLITALQNLRGQEAQTLIDNVGAQIGANQARGIDATISRNSAIAQIRADPDLMAALSPVQRTALDQINGTAADPGGRRAARLLEAAATSLTETNAGWAHLLNAAGANQQTITSIQGQNRILTTERGSAEAANTPLGRWVGAQQTVIDGMLARLRVQTGGQRTDTASHMTTILDNLARYLVSRQAGITGDDNTAHLNRQFIFQALAEIRTTRTEITNAVTPTRAEGRADAHRTAEELWNAFAEAYEAAGGTHASGRYGHRTAQDQNDIYRNQPGSTPLDGFVRRSRHQSWEAYDPSGGHADTQRAEAAAEAAGLHNFQIVAESRNRFHYQWRGGGASNTADVNGSERLQRQAEAAQRRQETAARTEEDRRNREIVATERVSLSTKDHALTDAVRNLRYTTTQAMFDTGAAAAQGALNDWGKQLLTVTNAQLTREHATSGERTARLAEVTESIHQKQAELDTAIFDGMTANVDRTIASIQRAYARAIQPTEARVSRLQGQVNGLGFASLDGRVPDYVQTLAGRRVARAQEDAARAQSTALGTQITDQRNAVNDFERTTRLANLDPAQAQTARDKVTALTDALMALVAQKESLDEALGASGLLPVSFRQGLDQAAEALRETNHLSRSFHDEVIMDMGTGLQSLHDSFKTFFTDIFSGTKTISQAFGDMAKAVLASLAQMLAQFAANQAMKLLLNLIGIGIGGSFGGVSGGSLGSGAAAAAAGRLNGGQIVKAYNGRYIGDGTPGRDTVDASISNGEYVTRKWAVDNVGVDFMTKLNNQGARALDGLRPGVVLPQPAHQEVKVYVVAPEQKPTMGPNDVLVAIADDIINGGQTKKLIAHVAQGG